MQRRVLAEGAHMGHNQRAYKLPVVTRGKHNNHAVSAE